jgi:hypothetical protein
MRLSDRLRWLLQHRLVVPAEEALEEIAGGPHRDNPEGAVARLASLNPANFLKSPAVCSASGSKPASESSSSAAGMTRSATPRSPAAA